MVVVAQLVESRIVIPVVVGSSPISHPSFSFHNPIHFKPHPLIAFLITVIVSVK